MFSRPAWVLYTVVLIAGGAACLSDPVVCPRPAHLFFSDYLLLVELTTLVGQLPLVLVHELFHILAGRRLGVPSHLRISNRFYVLVFETSMDGLVAVPRRQRYLPMLAGLLADGLAFSGLTLVAYFTRTSDGRISTTGGVCLALAFATLPRMAWQFFLHLRTDIYQLVALVLGCRDLHGTAMQYLANMVNTVLRRPDRRVDPDDWHPRERRIVRWYAPVVLVGYAFSAATLLAVVLPLAIRFFSTTVHRVVDGGQGSARFWDSVGVLALTLAQLAVAAVLALRERRSRTAGREPTCP